MLRLMENLRFTKAPTCAMALDMMGVCYLCGDFCLDEAGVCLRKRDKEMITEQKFRRFRRVDVVLRAESTQVRTVVLYFADNKRGAVAGRSRRGPTQKQLSFCTPSVLVSQIGAVWVGFQDLGSS